MTEKSSLMAKTVGGLDLDMNPIIHVVDDDPDSRSLLVEAMDSISLTTKEYSLATELLESFDPATPGCIVSDIRMPEMSGLNLYKKLLAKGVEIPMIFMTGYADVDMAVKAMKLGAFDFLQKPFRSFEILDSVQMAVEYSLIKTKERIEIEDRHRHLNSLTAREVEVLDEILDGHPNKVIAYQLGISEKTIEFHRSNIMGKLGVHSVAQLIMVLYPKS